MSGICNFLRKPVLKPGTTLSFLIMLLAAQTLRAQTELPRWRPYVNVQTGWAAGGASSGFLGTAAAGVRYRRWGFGLASGIDNDGVTSVPLLLDLRWALVPGRRHTLEFFSQQGWNVVTQESNAYFKTVYSNGPFLYSGITWKLFSTGKMTGFWLSAGASFKQYGFAKIYETDIPQGYLVPSPPGPLMFGPAPPPKPVEHKEWRGVLTLGWGWR